jgi:DNA end-binding protein Ku
LFYPDEIRKPESGALDQVAVDDRELTMAKTLVDFMQGSFSPESYTDEYRTALMERIEAKQHGGELRVAPEAQQTTVVNLMEALKASLEQAQRASGG